MYVYIVGEAENADYLRFHVGFYKASGHWYTESEHERPEHAARRVNYLNGGSGEFMPPETRTEVEKYPAC